VEVFIVAKQTSENSGTGFPNMRQDFAAAAPRGTGLSVAEREFETFARIDLAPGMSKLRQ
jgi:hypothetical protein